MQNRLTRSLQESRWLKGALRKLIGKPRTGSPAQTARTMVSQHLSCTWQTQDAILTCVLPISLESPDVASDAADDGGSCRLDDARWLEELDWISPGRSVVDGTSIVAVGDGAPRLDSAVGRGVSLTGRGKVGDWRGVLSEMPTSLEGEAWDNEEGAAGEAVKSGGGLPTVSWPDVTDEAGGDPELSTLAPAELRVGNISVGSWLSVGS